MNTIKKIFFIFFILLIMSTTVNADVTVTEISPSGYSITFTTNKIGEYISSYTMIYNNSNNNDNEDVRNVGVFFVKNQNDPKPNINDLINLQQDSISKGYLEFNKDFTLNKCQSTSTLININNDWWLTDGYDWFYVVKQIYADKDNHNTSYGFTYEITSSPIKVERPALPSINQRYDVFVSNNNNRISINPNFPGTIGSDYSGDPNIVTKIGRVTDKSILNKIKNNASDGYSSLLTYAKNNTGKEWTFNVHNTSESFNIQLDGFTVTNGEYYYIYTKMRNSDNLYRNTDGISLAMAKNDWLTSYVEWGDFTYDELPTSETTTKKATTTTKKTTTTQSETNVTTNAQTGTIEIIAAWLVGFIAIVFSVMYFKQTNKEEM